MKSLRQEPAVAGNRCVRSKAAAGALLVLVPQAVYAGSGAVGCLMLAVYAGLAVLRGCVLSAA